MTEVRSVSSTGGEKGVKPQRHSLIPKEGLDTIAEVFAFGAEKYAAHNWRKGYEWSKSYDALIRHLTAWFSGEDLDPESGLSHLGHAGFHIMALSTWQRLGGRYEQFDDRYVEPVAADVVEWCIDTNRSVDECVADGGCGDDVPPTCDCDDDCPGTPLGPEWTALGYTTEEGTAEDAGFRYVDDAPVVTLPAGFRPNLAYLDEAHLWTVDNPARPTLMNKADALRSLRSFFEAQGFPVVDHKAFAAPKFELTDLAPHLTAMQEGVNAMVKAQRDAEESVATQALETGQPTEIVIQHSIQGEDLEPTFRTYFPRIRDDLDTENGFTVLAVPGPYSPPRLFSVDGDGFTRELDAETGQEIYMLCVESQGTRWQG